MTRTNAEVVACWSTWPEHLRDRGYPYTLPDLKKKKINVPDLKKKKINVVSAI